MKSKPLVAQLTKHLNEKARSLSRQSPSDLKLPRTGLLARNNFWLVRDSGTVPLRERVRAEP